jgi:hypothetical protein
VPVLVLLNKSDLIEIKPNTDASNGDSKNMVEKEKLGAKWDEWASVLTLDRFRLPWSMR